MSHSLALTFAVRQHGVITRRQALDAGLTPSQIDRRAARDGPWQRVLPGVYVVHRGELTRTQREQAALLYAGPGAALTAGNACRHHGIDYAADDGLVHVAMDHRRRRASIAFVCMHRTIRLDEQQHTSDGLPVVPCAQAVVDYGLESLVLADVRAVTCEAAQRGRTTVDALVAALALAPQQQSALIRRAIGDVVAGARSAPEAELLDLIDFLELPPPQLNVDVLADDGTWLACVDFLWPELRLIVEVDSVQWHYADAGRDAATVARRERLRRHGFTVISVTPHDIRANPWAVGELLSAAVEKKAIFP